MRALLARLVTGDRTVLSDAWRREQLRREAIEGVEGPAWDWAAIKQASVKEDSDDHRPTTGSEQPR